MNLNQIIGFEWDIGNQNKSLNKHQVTNLEAEEIFFNDPLLLVEDIKHSQAELRFHALGKTNSTRRLHITFTLREEGTLIRVISARDMSRKEREIYEKS